MYTYTTIAEKKRKQTQKRKAKAKLVHLKEQKSKIITYIQIMKTFRK